MNNQPDEQENPHRALNFQELRSANLKRCNAVFHPKGGIEEWTPTDWATALGGEAGEALNEVKKLRREMDGNNLPRDQATREGHIQKIAYELADVIIYADLLAARLGINLSLAIRDKFNKVSDERQTSIKL
jgi:NTP pyrophosphatase (non-canonical NTP hydrolase)